MPRPVEQDLATLVASRIVAFDHAITNKFAGDKCPAVRPDRDTALTNMHILITDDV